MTGASGADDWVAPAPVATQQTPGWITDHLLDSLRFSETDTRPNRISPKGAKGPYQFMAPAAAEMGLADPFDEPTAREAARGYLTKYAPQFGNDPSLTLAAYNWGPGNVRKAVAAGRPIPQQVQDYASGILSRLNPISTAEAVPAAAVPPAPADDWVAPQLAAANDDWVKPAAAKGPGDDWVAPADESAPSLIPSLGHALGKGLATAGGDWVKTIQAIGGGTPETEAPESGRYAELEKPLTFGWPDLQHTLYKTVEGLAASSPALATSIAAALPLGATTPAGLTAGAVAFGATSAVQNIGPYFAAALKENPGDRDAAWRTGLEQAAADGAISAATFRLFSWAPFGGAVKNTLFQALGVQPAGAVVGAGAQAAIAGKPLTAEQAGEAALSGAVGTVVPMGAHAAIKKIAGKPEPKPGADDEARIAAAKAAAEAAAQADAARPPQPGEEAPQMKAGEPATQAESERLAAEAAENLRPRYTENEPRAPRLPIEAPERPVEEVPPITAAERDAASAEAGEDFVPPADRESPAPEGEPVPSTEDRAAQNTADLERGVETSHGPFFAGLKPAEAVAEAHRALHIGEQTTGSPALDLTMRKLLGWFPIGAAKKSEAISRVVAAKQLEGELGHKIAATAQRMFQPYAELSPDSRARVEQAAEILTLANRPLPQSLEIRNRPGDQSAYAEKSKPDETVTLSQEEYAALRAIDQLSKYLRQQDIERAIRQTGYEGPISKEALEQNLKDALQPPDKEGAPDKEMRQYAGPRSKALAELALNVFNDMKEHTQQFYWPLTRHGDYEIGVRPKPNAKIPAGYRSATQAAQGAPVGLERYEQVSTQPGVFGRTQRTGEHPPEVVSRIEALRQRYPEQLFDIAANRIDQTKTPFEAIETRLKAIDDGLAEQRRKGTTPDRMAALEVEHQRLVKDLYGEMRAGWRREREGIPGYSPDFGTAMARHILGAGYNIARGRYRNQLEEARSWAARNGTPTENRFIRDWLGSLDKQTPGVDALRKAGFLYFLTSPASITTVLSQQLQLAPYTLGMHTGYGRAFGSLLGAMKDASRGVRITKNGIEMDVDRAARTADERAFLRQQADIGTTNPQITNEFAGLSQRGAPRQPGQPERGKAGAYFDRVLRTASSGFGAAEQVNRVAMLLAARRAALNNPAVLAKADKVYADSPLWQRYKEMYGGLNPEMFAQYITNDTHFQAGKLNRPVIGRGVGALETQFHTFQMQALGLMGRMLKDQGSDGRIALALMAGGLGLMSGALGMPGAGNIAKWYDQVNALTGNDSNVIGDLDRWLGHKGLPGWAAEMLLHGAGRSVAGIEVGQRYGLGDVAPNSLADFIGGPAIGGIGMRLYGALQRAQNQQPLGAVGEALPTGLANIWKGSVSLPAEGYGPRAASGRTIPPSQITAGERVKQGLGFQPAEFARASEQRYNEAKIGQIQRSITNHYVNAVGLEYAYAQDFREAGDEAAAAKHEAEAQRLLDQATAAVGDPNVPNERKPTVTGKEIRNKAMADLNWTRALLAKTPKAAKAAVLEEMQRHGQIPP